jgi:hypothetical protein
MTQINQPTDKKPESQASPARPNEQGSISVTGFVKIFDPKTQQTFVETRA